MRWSRSASSVVIAAAGICGASVAYCRLPVWGVRSPGGPIDRTSDATAPSRAARDGPSERYVTVSSYAVYGTLKKTILPFAC